MKIFMMMLAPILCLAQQNQIHRNPKRYALVIGNGEYAHLPVLPTAVLEARLMKTALEAADFKVTLVENARMPELLTNDEANFLMQLKPGDVVFFYYSGHAVQGEDEDDYLLPVDFGPDSELRKNGFRVTRLLQDLLERDVALKFFMIEGSRPLGVQIRGVTGLGMIVPDLRDSGETLFAMPTQAGQLVIPLPPGRTSVFTEAVVERLGSPGLTPREVFDQASQDVLVRTAQRQIPFVSPVVVSDGFYFHSPVVTTEKSEPAAPPVVIVQRVETVPTNTRDREEYVFIPNGTFKMGCVPGDKKCKTNEKPQHEVKISAGFWMGRNEVTINAYERFVADSKKMFKMPGAPTYNSGWRTKDLPMVLVTWDQASAFCKWAGGRLPTEAEWEYAARAGMPDEIYPLNDENSRDKANFYGKSGNDQYEEAAPVHQFDPSAFNLYDMAGNVWEWVADRYSATPYSESPSVDPQGPSAGKEHVMRGGSFESKWQDSLRLSAREQGASAYNVGFRCVLEDTEQTKKLLNPH